ncbi:MAG: molybdate ABC transporter permease subunit [Gordonibacter sp.]|nr:molybdate ABC transporter permease subunit [Gordonibacter sp.]
MGIDLANRVEMPLRATYVLAFRVCALAFVALLVLACLPGVALATGGDEGDVTTPTLTAGSLSSGAVAAQDSTIADGEVLVDADGTSASLPGSPFALEGFSRAQVGSNSEVGEGYAGYRYYVNGTPGSMAVIVADSCIVVYVPAYTAQVVGFDEGSSESQAYLKTLLVALDAANAKGGSVLSRESNWIFSSDPIVEYQGVLFKFDQELKAGQYYATVIGVDGSDVTNPTNPAYMKLDHADFGTLASASDVQVVAPLTGIDAFMAFLAGIDMSPLWVTLKTTLTAIVFIFILGLLAAYFSLRIPARAQDIADSIFTIPMVLPPTVCGFLLLLAFGKNTPVGQWFMDIGFPLIFSWQATVLAAVVVAFPLMYRSARGAFENLDPNMLDAARTLGWSNAKIFFKLMLPLSWSSIAAGTVLSFARALGEFGATLFLAGNYLGITRTVPIAIYFEWMNGNIDVAIFWTVVIMVFSFVVILFINLWGRRTTKYRRGVGA